MAFNTPTAPRSLPEHTFMHPKASDSRSPCPALNALANQGYLPRDGRRISPPTLLNALRDVFNLSFPLAFLLCLGAIWSCSNPFRLNLHELSAHGKIEHDGSLVHDDARPGAKYAPISVNPILLQKLLATAAPGHGLSEMDLARVRAGKRVHLDWLHSKIAAGELALTWLLIKDQNGEVPLAALAQLYGEERIPDGWKRPDKSIGLRSAHRHAQAIATWVRKLVGV